MFSLSSGRPAPASLYTMVTRILNVEGMGSKRLLLKCSFDIITGRDLDSYWSVSLHDLPSAGCLVLDALTVGDKICG